MEDELHGIVFVTKEFLEFDDVVLGEGLVDALDLFGRIFGKRDFDEGSVVPGDDRFKIFAAFAGLEALECFMIFESGFAGVDAPIFGGDERFLELNESFEFGLEIGNGFALPESFENAGFDMEEDG